MGARVALSHLRWRFVRCTCSGTDLVGGDFVHEEAPGDGAEAEEGEGAVNMRHIGAASCLPPPPPPLQDDRDDAADVPPHLRPRAEEVGGAVLCSEPCRPALGHCSSRSSSRGGQARE